MSQGKLAFAKSSFSGVHILLLLRMIASAGTDRGGGVVAGKVVVTPVTREKNGVSTPRCASGGNSREKSSSGTVTCGRAQQEEDGRSSANRRRWHP